MSSVVDVSKYKLFSCAGLTGGAIVSLGVFLAGDSLRGRGWAFDGWGVNLSYVVSFCGLAACITLALVIAQGMYLRTPLALSRIINISMLAAIGGAVTGVLAPNISVQFTLSDHIARYANWTLCASIVGLTVSMAVANLPKSVGTASGALGGFLGCLVGYTIDWRLGFPTMGLLIGLIMAGAERASRQAWLEVQIFEEGAGAKPRLVEMTVGQTPIRLGYDPSSDIRLEAIAGAPAEFAVVHSDGDDIIWHDLLRRTALPMGDRPVKISNATVQLRRK